MRRLSTASRLAAAATALVVTGIAGPIPAASAAPAYADADSATVHPGVQTFTDGAQCTANFVFSNGSDVYIGQAAHCSGTGGSTETNGCDAGSLPLGTKVEVDGASRPGTMVYNSWLAMQQAGETNRDACDYNDFALVQLDPADVSKTNPSIPFYGGPTGVDTDGSGTGEEVYSYGNSGLRLGLEPLSPKTGVTVTEQGNGWSHAVYTATPGVPGDSGSAFVSDDGTALGVLSTLAIAPLAGSNGVSDLAKSLSYAQSHGAAGVTLVSGTEDFSPVL